RGEAGHHRVEPFGIRPAGFGGHLRTAQLGGGDHLHRLGDLLGRLHRGDADLEGFEAGHLFPVSYRFVAPAKAGTYFSSHTRHSPWRETWAPAFAGATRSFTQTSWRTPRSHP